MPSKNSNWTPLKHGEPVAYLERRWMLFAFETPPVVVAGYFKTVFNIAMQRNDAIVIAPGLMRNSDPTHFCDCLPDDFQPIQKETIDATHKS